MRHFRQYLGFPGHPALHRRCDLRRWYFIASPTIDGGLPYNATENTYDLYWLNGTQWENVKSHDDFKGMVNGRGYLYANSGDVQNGNNRDLVLNYSGNSAPYDDEHRRVTVTAGWNLVGNPFLFNVYLDRPYYKMNATGTAAELVERYWEQPIALPSTTPT